MAEGKTKLKDTEAMQGKASKKKRADLGPGQPWWQHGWPVILSASRFWELEQCHVPM